MENFSVFAGLRGHFHGHTGLEPALFPLHPQLFQVKGQGQQEQLRADVGLAPGQKTAESKVVLQQTKGALHLNRAAKTQMEPSLGHDILLCLLPLLPEGFLENELLGPVRILGPAALCPAGTAAAILTPVQGGGHKLSVLHLRCLPPQIQLPSLGAGEAVFFGVIFHVLNAAHLLLKFPGPLLLVVGGLYEAHLAVALQIQIVLQAFITRIRHHFLIAGLVLLGQLLQHGTQRPHIRAVWECFQPGDIFAVYRDLDIVPRLELAVSHVVLFHSHKGGIRVGFRAAVASFSHGGELWLCDKRKMCLR